MSNWKYFKNETPKCGTVIRTATFFNDDPEPIIDVKVLYNQFEVDQLIEHIQSYDFDKSMWEFITDINLNEADPYKRKNINFSIIETNNSQWDLYEKQRLERGYDDSETWNLDSTIANFVLPRLKTFKEVKNGYPGELNSEKEWDEILDKIIAAFEMHEKDKFEFSRTEEEEKERYSRVQEGLNLFAKYFWNLWW